MYQLLHVYDTCNCHISLSISPNPCIRVPLGLYDYTVTSRSISTVSYIPVLYHCGYMIITVTVLVPAVKFLHVVAVRDVYYQGRLCFYS